MSADLSSIAVTRSRASRCAPLQVVARPVGSACNLRCSHCLPSGQQDGCAPAGDARMDDATLEALVRGSLQSSDASEIVFSWDGGEPTLRGLEFFRKAVQLQQRHADGRSVRNTLQTNATLIDAEWAAFLAQHGFTVAVRVDGPAELHDAHRIDAAGQPTSQRVRLAVERLKAHDVPVHAITRVGALNARHPARVYQYLKELGATRIEFLPLVQRQAKGAGRPMLAGPPERRSQRDTELARWSVGSIAYGRFLTTVFGEWVRQDVGRIVVQPFDSTLRGWSDDGPKLCTFSETCGRKLAVDHDGSWYACERYVDPAFRAGAVAEQSLDEVLEGSAQRAFGDAKRDALPTQCRRCDVLAACRGGCPSHRFIYAPAGGPGVNYLCAGYRHFFRTVAPHMRAMAALLRQGRPASDIMRR
jgi:uncharacterized protein